MRSPRSTPKSGKSSRAFRTDNGTGVIPPVEIHGVEPEDTDMMLFVRDGHPILRTPQHDGGVVPEDFLILLGVSVVFLDPGFRAKMLSIVHEAGARGMLSDIIHVGSSN